MTREKREKEIHDIYTFYTKQTYFTGKKATFDRMDHESNVLSLGK